MGKKSSIRSLSQQLGLSPSTVFRALNSCGDVDLKTAARVREFAQQQGYAPPKRARIPRCALIFPDRPDYFWGEARRLFQKRLPTQFAGRFFLYSQLDDIDGFCSSLQDALSYEPSLLILAAPKHPAVLEMLRDLTVPIFFFGESVPLVNSFFFGSDSYEDGCCLGEVFSQRYSLCRSVLCFCSETVSQTAARRTEGFLSATPQLTVVAKLSLDCAGKPYAASVLARSIATAKSFDCVFCDTGVLPDLCCALDKCRIPNSVPCVGFENPAALAPYREGGRLGAVLVQNLEAQVDSCVAAVDRYLSSGVFPNQKMITVPSFVL
ncbi:MAG: LacI family DNA-binding transcriptional regulator [Clostridia bacterium]|nr:LacI family DNA-binding transcriptional regulator [Clostridia bacterium]